MKGNKAGNKADAAHVDGCEYRDQSVEMPATGDAKASVVNC